MLGSGNEPPEGWVQKFLGRLLIGDVCEKNLEPCAVLNEVFQDMTEIKGTRQGEWKQHWQWLL